MRWVKSGRIWQRFMFLYKRLWLRFSLEMLIRWIETISWKSFGKFVGFLKLELELGQVTFQLCWGSKICLAHQNSVKIRGSGKVTLTEDGNSEDQDKGDAIRKLWQNMSLQFGSSYNSFARRTVHSLQWHKIKELLHACIQQHLFRIRRAWCCIVHIYLPPLHYCSIDTE